jgi:hypothetical protein
LLCWAPWGAFFVLTPAQAADYRVIQWNDTKICQVVDMAGPFKPIRSNYTVLTKKSLSTFEAATKARAAVGAKAKCVL